MCCFSSFNKQTVGPLCLGPHNCLHIGTLASQKPSSWGGQQLGQSQLSCWGYPVSMPSSLNHFCACPKGPMPLAYPWPSPKGGHTARWQTKVPQLTQALGSWAVRLDTGNLLLLQGLSSTTISLSGCCSPTRQAGGRGTPHNSWSIFSLHQNNLTADGIYNAAPPHP